MKGPQGIIFIILAQIFLISHQIPGTFQAEPCTPTPYECRANKDCCKGNCIGYVPDWKLGQCSDTPQAPTKGASPPATAPKNAGPPPPQPPKVTASSPSGSDGGKDYEKAALTAHNTYRAKHKSPPLTLDSDLSKKAQKCAEYYAGKDQIDHSCPYKGDAGENLHYQSSSATPTLPAVATRATDEFYKEISSYDYKKAVFTPTSGHFTQVVWKASTKLGVGIASKGAKFYGTFLYSPAGNVQSLFKDNVLPPK